MGRADSPNGPCGETPARRLARQRLGRLPEGRPPRQGVVRRLRAVVAYDGSAYSGWQRQPDAVTVQEVIEVALEGVLRHRTPVTAAGRTDAGVHAEGQVISFETPALLPPDGLRAMLQQVLPPDIRVAGVDEAAAEFDPRRHAVSKLYRYTVLLGDGPAPAVERTAWRLSGTLDADAMRAAAAHLLGTHDFRAFRTDPGAARRDEGTVRHIDAIRVLRAWERVRIEVEGPGFLYMMVRNIAAALVRVGRGEAPPGWVGDVLAGRDRALLPPPAPARGLTLVEVRYEPGPPHERPGRGPPRRR